MRVQVPVSVGELLDKISILEIKAQRIDDPEKIRNVRRELELLRAVWESSDRPTEVTPEVDRIRASLRGVNEDLWEIEDRIRDKEGEGSFDDEFIELARSVYLTNDRRARLKKELNLLLGSELVEEKSYTSYGDAEGEGAAPSTS